MHKRPGIAASSRGLSLTTFASKKDLGFTPYHFSQKSGKGFTLIELLVVIAIIGMLASVVLASMSGVRERARDTRRLQDLRNIQTALELYYTDNKHYPYSCSTNVWTSFDSSQYSVNQLCSTLNGATPIGTLSQVMAPYIGRPTDPKNLGGDSGYLYINQRAA